MLCLIHFWLLREVQCAGPNVGIKTHIQLVICLTNKHTRAHTHTSTHANTHAHTHVCIYIYMLVFNNFLTDVVMNLWNTLFCSHRYVDNFLLHTLQVKRSLGTPRGFAAPLGVFQAFNSPTETYLIWKLPLSRSPCTSLSSYQLTQ